MLLHRGAERVICDFNLFDSRGSSEDRNDEFVAFASKDDVSSGLPDHLTEEEPRIESTKENEAEPNDSLFAY